MATATAQATQEKNIAELNQLITSIRGNANLALEALHGTEHYLKETLRQQLEAEGQQIVRSLGTFVDNPLLDRVKQAGYEWKNVLLMTEAQGKMVGRTVGDIAATVEAIAWNLRHPIRPQLYAELADIQQRIDHAKKRLLTYKAWMNKFMRTDIFQYPLTELNQAKDRLQGARNLLLTYRRELNIFRKTRKRSA